jgi:hypothetical protein
MALNNKPSMMLFYSGIGIFDPPNPRGKLRAGAKCGFGPRLRDRAAYARMRRLPRTQRSARLFAAWCVAVPGR